MKIDPRAGLPTKVTGTIKPIRDHILVTDMNFEERKSLGGIILPSDDGKSEGIRHRWARVWAVGPEQTEVSVGEWILLEHGRWTRGFVVVEGADEIVVRRADNNAILMVSAEKPDERLMETFGAHSKVSHAEFDPSTFARPSFEQ
jgi:co-chaperonin GroES (HSP10)